MTENYRIEYKRELSDGLEEVPRRPITLQNQFAQPTKTTRPCQPGKITGAINSLLQRAFKGELTDDNRAA